MLQRQLRPGRLPACAVEWMPAEMRMAGGSRRRLACRLVLDGRVPSAFHPRRAAAAKSPGLPLCADDHGQRRDQPSRQSERPELRRNAGTRLPWRIAPRFAPDIGTGLAPPGLGPMSRAVRRGLAQPQPSIHLAAQVGTSSRAHQKAGGGTDSAESGAYGACDSVRGEWQPRRARNQNLDQNLEQSLLPRPQQFQRPWY